MSFLFLLAICICSQRCLTCMARVGHNSFVESVMRNASLGRASSVMSVGTGIMSSVSSWKYRFCRHSKNSLRRPTFADHAAVMKKEHSATNSPSTVCTRYTLVFTCKNVYYQYITVFIILWCNHVSLLTIMIKELAFSDLNGNPENNSLSAWKNGTHGKNKIHSTFFVIESTLDLISIWSVFSITNLLMSTRLIKKVTFTQIKSILCLHFKAVSKVVFLCGFDWNLQGQQQLQGSSWKLLG